MRSVPLPPFFSSNRYIPAYPQSLTHSPYLPVLASSAVTPRLTLCQHICPSLTPFPHITQAFQLFFWLLLLICISFFFPASQFSHSPANSSNSICSLLGCCIHLIMSHLFIFFSKCQGFLTHQEMQKSSHLSRSLLYGLNLYSTANVKPLSHTHTHTSGTFTLLCPNIHNAPLLLI